MNRNWDNLNNSLAEIFKICGVPEEENLSTRYLRVISLRAILELEEQIPHTQKNSSPQEIVNYLDSKYSSTEISDAFSAATAKVINPVFELILPKLNSEQITDINAIMEKLNPPNSHTHA